MYYPYHMYPYPYFGYPPMYTPDLMVSQQQVSETIHDFIKRSATAVDFYSRLAKSAPNQKQKNNILQALEDEKVHLNQLSELYVHLTGRQPIYEIEEVSFNTYSDGLQKAYEIAVQDYNEYQNSYLLAQHYPFRDIFLRACHNEAKHANLFRSLSSIQEVKIALRDSGKKPFVVNIERAAEQNNNFRTAIWTGNHLQVTLMSIGVGEDIGLEVHPNVDQFLRIEEGRGLVQMGDRRDRLDFQARVYEDYAIMVPAGKWHNLINTGNKPLKLYSIYAPPEHPFGTVHKTKADAMRAD